MLRLGLLGVYCIACLVLSWTRPYDERDHSVLASKLYFCFASNLTLQWAQVLLRLEVTGNSAGNRIVQLLCV